MDSNGTQLASMDEDEIDLNRNFYSVGNRIAPTTLMVQH